MVLWRNTLLGLMSPEAVRFDGLMMWHIEILLFVLLLLAITVNMF